MAESLRIEQEKIKDVTLKLLSYCRQNDWAGYDPYDALNSEMFKRLSFLDYRLPRLILTQAMKRIPINLRKLLLIPKTQNAKGLALFVEALLKLSRLGVVAKDEMVGNIVERIKELRAPHSRYWCWGYSFPWQTRTELVPRYAPNIVCTAFVADALLDLYEACGDKGNLLMASSAAGYVVDELFWTSGNAVAGFGYPSPSSRNQTHNANFLGAALLCKVYKYNGEKKFLNPALKVARYSAGQQRENGSWDYGEASTQGWVDNFHTGYNLCALRDIGVYAETKEFEACIERGFDFYRANFFKEDGAPKYFYNSTYPIDIHSVAQSIITLVRLEDLAKDSLKLAYSVTTWALENMWDDQGYFHYQIGSFCRNKIPYMRWAQAWMLLALSVLLEHFHQVNFLTANSERITKGASPIL